MESHIVSNVVVGVLLLMAAASVWGVRRSRMWSEAFGEIWHRRRLAICVVFLYVGIALLDSIAWVGGDGIPWSRPGP